MVYRGEADQKSAEGVVESNDVIARRELFFLDAMTRFPMEKIPFLLGTPKNNRRNLEPGDIIYARNSGENSHLGMLVTIGRGAAARCTPLFYLKRGNPVMSLGVDLHSPNLFEPKIAFERKALKPTDRNGNYILYEPSDVAIMRPKDKKITTLVNDFKKKYNMALLTQNIAILILGTDIVGGFITGLEAFGAGQSPSSGVIIFQETGLFLGGGIFHLSLNFQKQALKVWDTFVRNYANLFYGECRSYIQRSFGI